MGKSLVYDSRHYAHYATSIPHVLLGTKERVLDSWGEIFCPLRYHLSMCPFYPSEGCSQRQLTLGFKIHKNTPKIELVV